MNFLGWLRRRGKMSQNTTYMDPERQVLFWNKEITGSTTEDVIIKVNELLVKDKNKPIYLIINSSGGNCAHGYALYSWLRMIAPDLINTIAVGQIASMAMILFLAGKRRIVTRQCSSLLHEPSQQISSGTSMQIRTHVESAQSLKEWKELYIEEIMRRLPNDTDFKKIRRMITKSTTIWGPEIYKLGFATELV